jgi:hypothetical protein
MIEIISPGLNEVIGGSRAAQTYTTLASWNMAYISGVFEWLTDYDTVGGTVWPDTDGTGETVRVYNIPIWLRTDSLKYRVDIKNHTYVEFPDGFHPLDEEGVPYPDPYWIIDTGDSPFYSAHIMLPLAFSWIDPATGTRDYAQGNRTIIIRTEPAVGGEFDEEVSTFVIDIKPPGKPVFSTESQILDTGTSKTTATSRKVNIKAVIPNIDGGSYRITIES